VDAAALRARIEEHIRRHDLIPPGGDVVCLVSGGPDSTCLWHALGALGYRAGALHVNHRLRGAESEEDARFCRERLGAEVVEAPPSEGGSEAELRELRYEASNTVLQGRLRATGHTASDQIETVLYRLAASGTTTGIPVRREDGVVRPLLSVWREETEAYCGAEGLEFRRDSTNDDTLRGLIRRDLVPALRKLHPAAEENVLRAAQQPRKLPRRTERALLELLDSQAGAKRVDLGDGRVAVREYGSVWLERAPVRLDGPVSWGPWRLQPRRTGLWVRSWRAGDRLASRGKKVQDLFVDAKVPRSEREAWPLVVKGDEVVDEETLQGRIRELGTQVSDDYRGRDLLLIGVLKGAIFFMADLMRSIDIQCEVDFMAISSYGAGVDSSGVVRILKDLDVSIEGRNVLVVEDIIDSGLTLSYLLRNLEAREPASLEVCALLTKPERRENDVLCRYVGFDIPNRFVIGYGLDFAERYRNLPYVGVLRDELVAQAEDAV
jgi:hypoxanthine phosphoribosyltransferase